MGITTLKFRRFLRQVIFLLPLLIFLFSCEPLATRFQDTEDAQYATASKLKQAPDKVSQLKIATWNIRFGAARIPWFGDACGDRVVITQDEVYTSLKGITGMIDSLGLDILLLQEVDIDSKRSSYINELQYILDNTQFNYAVYGSQWKAQFIPSDGLGRLNEGNAILSRWKITEGKRMQLSLRSDQDQLTRYFYERCCMVEGRIDIPGINGTEALYILNIHASAFATDDTKHQHLISFKSEMDMLNASQKIFISGGDLNTLPPGSDTTDYCIQDMCPWESFHAEGDDPFHKDGSNYTPEKEWLVPIYYEYHPVIPLDVYQQDQHHYFSHTTRPTHFWDRTLDHLFTNYSWAVGSGKVQQQATKLSDHAPVTGVFILPQKK